MNGQTAEIARLTRNCMRCATPPATIEAIPLIVAFDHFPKKARPVWMRMVIDVKTGVGRVHARAGSRPGAGARAG